MDLEKLFERFSLIEVFISTVWPCRINEQLLTSKLSVTLYSNKRLYESMTELLKGDRREMPGATVSTVIALRVLFPCNLPVLLSKQETNHSYSPSWASSMVKLCRA